MTSFRVTPSAASSRIGLDADLGELSADHDDLADAGHGEEAVAEVVLGAGAQVERGDGAGRGCEGDEHDLAGHGDVGGDFGVGVGREGLADAGEALEDVEARAGEVRRPVEVDPDEGESAARARADAGDARDAVDGGFDRARDLLLDLLGGESAGFGLHDDLRGADVREDVDGESVEDADADEGESDEDRERQFRGGEKGFEESHHAAILPQRARVIQLEGPNIAKSSSWR